MAKWICKCGERLTNSVIENIRFYSYYDCNKDLEDVEKYFEEDKLYKHYEMMDKLPNRYIEQCIKCGRLWFSIDETIVADNEYVKQLVSTSNILSFKPEPTFINNSVDILEEFERIAKEQGLEFKLEFKNNSYNLKIGDKEISDNNLSSIYQILVYGEKFE